MRQNLIVCDYPGCTQPPIDPAQVVTISASVPGQPPRMVQFDLCPVHAPPLAAQLGVTIQYPPPATGA